MNRHPNGRRGALILAMLAALVAAATITPGSSAAAATPNPFRHMPAVPGFHLSSRSITDGRPLPRAQWSTMSKAAGAKNISPQLSWARVSGARSYAITMYDPQAPVEGGAVQWAVANIPASTHALAAGAGSLRSRLLPRGASEVPDTVAPGYNGGAPQPHTGTHDYYITVWALDVRRIALAPGAPFGSFNFGLVEHTIARASIVCPTAAS